MSEYVPSPSYRKQSKFVVHIWYRDARMGIDVHFHVRRRPHPTRPGLKILPLSQEDRHLRDISTRPDQGLHLVIDDAVGRNLLMTIVVVTMTERARRRNGRTRIRKERRIKIDLDRARGKEEAS